MKLASLTKLTLTLIPEDMIRGVIPEPEMVANTVEPSVSVTVTRSLNASV